MKTILEELKQTKPFLTKGSELTVALVRTASQLKRGLEDELEPHGITLQQFNVLRILRGAQGPLPTMEIGSRMIEREPGITRLLSRLESKGLVIRNKCSSDGRRVWIEITKKGQDTLDKVGEPSEFAIQRSIDILTEKEMDAMLISLGKVRSDLSR